MPVGLINRMSCYGSIGHLTLVLKLSVRYSPSKVTVLSISTHRIDLVFPWPLVRDLKLPRRREKIGLIVILGLGVITIAVSTGRFVHMDTVGPGLGNCE